MSMNYFSETGYGIFLTDIEMMVFAKKMNEVNDASKEDLLDLLYNLPDSIVVSDDNFDQRHVFFLNGEETWDTWDSANGLMLYSKKQGSIFRNEEKKLYSGPDEMVKEFEDRYRKYLPDNFDIKSRLCYFAGAIFL